MAKYLLIEHLSLCLFFPLYFFNLRIFALQSFVVFCHISTRISHRYMHVPSLPNLPSTFLLIPPFYIVTAPLFEFPESISKFPLGYLFSIWYYKFPCYSLHTSHSLPFAKNFVNGIDAILKHCTCKCN